MQRGNAAYVHEMTDSDHRDMSEVVEQLKGMVIICGYESELYDELFAPWTKVRREAFADGAAKRIECLWLNKNCNIAQLKIF